MSHDFQRRTIEVGPKVGIGSTTTDGQMVVCLVGIGGGYQRALLETPYPHRLEAANEQGICTDCGSRPLDRRPPGA